jgi:hypothetical protein
MWPECCRILIGYTAWIPSPTPRLFVGRVTDTYTWIPCSDGINCCIGTAFANMEMDVTLPGGGVARLATEVKTGHGSC